MSKDYQYFYPRFSIFLSLYLPEIQLCFLCEVIQLIIMSLNLFIVYPYLCCLTQTWTHICLGLSFCVTCMQHLRQSSMGAGTLLKSDNALLSFLLASYLTSTHCVSSFAQHLHLPFPVFFTILAYA